MIINNNSVEQINIALLDLEKKLSTIKHNKSVIDSLRNDINFIKASLNETKAGLTSGATYDISITGNATTATTANTASSAVSAELAKRASGDENGSLITATYQKAFEKNAVAGYVKCNQTVNGSYILVAEVNNGAVTYSWVARS